MTPTNGLVGFRTETGSFDTLLSAYQFNRAAGSIFAELREVARADDSEGMEQEIEVEFGVFTGERYEIALDGYFGTMSKLELEWRFAPLPAPPAKVLSSLPDRAVNPGDNVTLTFPVTNAAASQFKWRFNGNEIPNITSTNLAIPNFQSTNVGRYKFRVNSGGGSGALGSAGPVMQAFGGGVTANGSSPAGVVPGCNSSQVFNTTYAVVDTKELARSRFPPGAGGFISFCLSCPTAHFARLPKSWDLSQGQGSQDHFHTTKIAARANEK